MMEKYSKIKRLGHPDTDGILADGELVIQEKLDGANFRFCHQTHLDEQYQTDGRELVFGSRNVVWKNEKDVDSAFEHAIEYVRENIHDAGIKQLRNNPVVVYGEAMHPHTLEYDWDEVPSFVGFDVYDTSKEEFLPHDWMRTAFWSMDLPVAPEVAIYDDPSAFDVDTFEIPDSEFRDGTAEGVVLKNHEAGVYAKMRSEEFLEKHGSASSKNFVPDDDTGKLVATYVTDARIEKHAHKLVDVGEYDGIQMEMMEQLPMRVINDVFEEEHEEIVLENWEVDFGNLRSKASKRCARTLQSIMRAQA